MNDKLRILDIVEETTADGPGFRTSIYCAGCLHKCLGCHNPESWNMNGGKEMTIDELFDIIVSDDLSDVTFSGGDPFYQVDGFKKLAKRIKNETNKTIWCYTGFLYEDIIKVPKMASILPYIDVLVDGPFVLEKRNTDLKFRGSENQRLIHLKDGKVDFIEY